MSATSFTLSLLLATAGPVLQTDSASESGAALAPSSALAASASPLANAKPLDRFPASLKLRGKTLLKNGQGLCEYGIFGIDVYYAALYLERRTTDAKTAITSKQSKRLVMRWARDLSKSDLGKAWRAGFKANAGRDLAKVQAGLTRLCDLMTKVKKGEEMTFDHAPGRGLTVIIGTGKARLVSSDDAFAEMFFRCFLGKTPPDPNLRKGLLRGRA